MLDQEINEQLGLLQRELSRLKSATDYIDGAKENSTKIIRDLEKVQLNYSVYSEKIFSLYKQYIVDLKQTTQNQINEGVLKFETTGNQIDITNKEKLVETKRLLEQYKRIVEATDGLVKIIEGVDFPNRLAAIDNNVKSTIVAVKEAGNSIINKIGDNQTIILEKLNHQEKEIKQLKTVAFVICGITVLGILIAVF